MASILAPGTGVATSTNVVVPQGGTAKIGIYVASGLIPARAALVVQEVTPGAPNRVTHLDHLTTSVLLPGPGTYNVARPDISKYGVGIGVYSE